MMMNQCNSLHDYRFIQYVKELQEERFRPYKKRRCLNEEAIIVLSSETLLLSYYLV